MRKNSSTFIEPNQATNQRLLESPFVCAAAKNSWCIELHSNSFVRLTLQLATEHANPFGRAMSICRQLELFFLKLHCLRMPKLIQVEQRTVRLLFLD